MEYEEFEVWVEKARGQVQERISAAQARFGLGSHARYAIDLPTATIRFFDAQDVERVRADVQVAGSWSPTSESWLWGWENASVPEIASSRLSAIREHGQAQDIPPLCSSFAPCDEGTAWSMAALACQLLDAECMYRAPNDKNDVFLLLFAIRSVH